MFSRFALLVSVGVFGYNGQYGVSVFETDFWPNTNIDEKIRECARSDDPCTLEDLKNEIALNNEFFNFGHEKVDLPGTHLPILGSPVYPQNVTAMYLRKCGIVSNFFSKLEQ